MAGKANLYSSGSPVTVSRDYQTMSDYSTPDFYQRQKNGEVIAHDMYSLKREFRNGDWSVTVDYGLSHAGNQPATHNTYRKFDNAVSESIFFGYDWSHIPNLDEGLDYAGNQALIKAYAKAASSQMQSLVTLAELHKTLGLIRSLGQRLIDLPQKNGALFAALRKGIRNPSRTLKGGKKALVKGLSNSSLKTANQWLQYRYGIRQLFFDITAAQDAMMAYKKPTRFRFHSTAAGPSYTDTDRLISDGGYLTVSNKRRITSDAHLTSEVSAGLLVSPRLGGLSRLNDAFGVTQVLPTIWDLTRFSWVIDRFLNIGDVLRAMELNLHKEVLCSWIVKRVFDNRALRFYVYSKDIGVESVNSWVSYDTRATPGYCSQTGQTDHVVSCNDLHVTRKANPALIYLPTVKPRVDLSFLADLAALVRQAYSR
jgi:hypothetical protein